MVRMNAMPALSLPPGAANYQPEDDDALDYDDHLTSYGFDDRHEPSSSSFAPPVIKLVPMSFEERLMQEEKLANAMRAAVDALRRQRFGEADYGDYIRELTPGELASRRLRKSDIWDLGEAKDCVICVWPGRRYNLRPPFHNVTLDLTDFNRAQPSKGIVLPSEIRTPFGVVCVIPCKTGYYLDTSRYHGNTRFKAKNCGFNFSYSWINPVSS